MDTRRATTWPHAAPAVAAAGGTLKTAELDKGMIVRYDAAGNRQEIAFNFKKMLTGKQADLFIEPRDIIFVPGSTAKTVGYGFLGIARDLACSRSHPGNYPLVKFLPIYNK